ncbi:hypothetical protein FRC18_011354 [Serendipita sp. 400]|nr:hypothetical protein FRC18_011354 [Serendipita sp. 400]
MYRSKFGTKEAAHAPELNLGSCRRDKGNILQPTVLVLPNTQLLSTYGPTPKELDIGWSLCCGHIILVKVVLQARL